LIFSSVEPELKLVPVDFYTEIFILKRFELYWEAALLLNLTADLLNVGLGTFLNAADDA